MTVYRVGPDGATVFDEDGTVVMRLRPGQRIVAGTNEAAGRLSAAAQERKRLREYADKRMRPTEDKH